jgi:hypothetical protein
MFGVVVFFYVTLPFYGLGNDAQRLFSERNERREITMKYS